MGCRQIYTGSGQHQDFCILDNINLSEWRQLCLRWIAGEVATGIGLRCRFVVVHVLCREQIHHPDGFLLG